MRNGETIEVMWIGKNDPIPAGWSPVEGGMPMHHDYWSKMITRKVDEGERDSKRRGGSGGGRPRGKPRR